MAGHVALAESIQTHLCLVKSQKKKLLVFKVMALIIASKVIAS